MLLASNTGLISLGSGHSWEGAETTKVVELRAGITSQYLRTYLVIASCLKPYDTEFIS